jgi:hypothetical protein
MTAIRPEVIEAFLAVDPESFGQDPSCWTVDGEPITAEHRALIFDMNLAEMEHLKRGMDDLKRQLNAPNN